MQVFALVGFVRLQVTPFPLLYGASFLAFCACSFELSGSAETENAPREPPRSRNASVCMNRPILKWNNKSLGDLVHGLDWELQMSNMLRLDINSGSQLIFFWPEQTSATCVFLYFCLELDENIYVIWNVSLTSSDNVAQGQDEQQSFHCGLQNKIENLKSCRPFCSAIQWPVHTFFSKGCSCKTHAVVYTQVFSRQNGRQWSI